MVLLILAGSAAFLIAGGLWYSRFLARAWGEDSGRMGPSVAINDGRDFVPTPTSVVFAHHFASIAGAGPIIGPVTAIIYGWGPALFWVLIGGVFIGAVHDYLATFMATREGGRSIATVARTMLGNRVFVALTILLVVMLALVCGAFMSLSATALTSMLPFARLGLGSDQSFFRVVGEKVVIGGIASTSVIVITAVAPLLGWMYIKKSVPVWICSVLALAVCAISIAVGLFHPVALPESVGVLGATLSGDRVWMLLLSLYVLIAAGVPVWIFLQSRDFINVHILYIGLAGLMVTLVVAGLRGATPVEALAIPGAAAAGGLVEQGLPFLNIAEGTKALGWFWPGLFIVIACGAVSGFHSLCAGGTTCKQLKTEGAARRVGYFAMLLETFLAVGVIAVLMVGTTKLNYIRDVHPGLLGPGGKANAVLGFAMAVGNAVHIAYGVPIAIGAVAGMVLLEGFLVTTLDTAVRLTRYLIEEIWRSFFGKYDVFAEPVAVRDPAVAMATGDGTPSGADGIPYAPAVEDQPPAPAVPIATRGAFRWLLLSLRQYWVNSGIAAALTLWLAWSGGYKKIWVIFGTSNQLLAAIVLALGSLWLIRRGRRAIYTMVPAVLMLITTFFGLGQLLVGYVRTVWTAFSTGVQIKPGTLPLLLADVVIIVIVLYLTVAGTRSALKRTGGNGAPARSVNG